MIERKIPMNEIKTVYAPRINVAGVVLSRQDDGNYTGSVVRHESSVVDGWKNNKDVWEHRAVKVPWDLRVGQEWLRAYPGAWEPAQ